MDNMKIEEGIFGKVDVIKNKNIGIKPEKILAPFAEADSAARMFCENCEGYYEIPQEAVEKLLSQTGAENNLKKGEYICTDGCVVCNKERTHVSVKKIEVH